MFPWLESKPAPPDWSLKRDDIQRFQITSRVETTRTQGGNVHTTYYNIQAIMHDGRELPILGSPSTNQATVQQLLDQLQAWLREDSAS